MIKSETLACGVILAALAIAVPNVRAQFPPPPPLPTEASAPPIPQRDISAEITQMTNRYGLSEDQAKKVRAVLEDHTTKAEAVAKDESLSPEERINHLLSVREEEIAQISDVLTPEQKKEYQADVHPAGPPKHSSDVESKPSSPTSE